MTDPIPTDRERLARLVSYLLSNDWDMDSLHDEGWEGWAFLEELGLAQTVEADREKHPWYDGDDGDQIFVLTLAGQELLVQGDQLNG